MKKCKITVLKTTLDKELAQEYGAEGLTACPMMKEGRYFTQIMPSLRDFVMRHGKQSISMYSHCLTEQETMCFITETGSGNLAWLSAAVTTGLRPVIFKIESTEEESQIDYVPVR